MYYSFVLYTDRSKSIGRKVDYAAVFADTTRRGVLPEEASIHTAEMTAMKDIKEREDIRWVIYTHICWSSRTTEKITQ